MDSLFYTLGVVFALLAGIFAWHAIYDRLQRIHYIRKLTDEDLEADGSVSPSTCGLSAMDRKVIGMICEASVKERIVGSARLDKSTCASDIQDRGSLFASYLTSSRWFRSNVDKTGLCGRISETGFCKTRIRLAFVFGSILALVGAMFSTELCLILLLLGAITGWRAPERACGHLIENRSQQMEHHLPEMLDVMALGMRSGLSFDSSVKLYAAHFKTYLSQEFSMAQRQWQSGLEHRDEALRRIADSYDSQIFKRIVETMIRSIRFGSSMVENLEEQSREARVAYRARREEQVAKAPVKMMIPTGVLILPAMLILVVGPVLLELMGGGL